MIYLLGGPPRVGKSLISGQIRKDHAVSVISTDSLGAVLENVLDPEAVPDLFVFDRFRGLTMTEQVTLMASDPAMLIDYVIAESGVVWKAVEAFANSESEERRDALIEGVAVFPEFVRRLKDIPHRAVFIGNQADSHRENIKRFAEDNEHDWMRDADDRYISTFAECVKRMSAYLERQAKQYGFRYVEMDNKSLGNVTSEVVSSLGLRND